MQANFLFLTTMQPSRRASGGEIASSEVIDGLRRLGSKVTVIAFEDIEENINTTKWKISSYLKAIFRNSPITVEKFRSNRFASLISNVMTAQRFDGVILDHSNMTWLSEIISGIPVIYIAHNSESKTYHQLAKNSSGISIYKRAAYLRESSLLKSVERDICEIAKVVGSFTHDDADSLHELSKNRARIVNLPLNPFRPSSSSSLSKYPVGMIGSWTWESNLRGLVWFLDTIASQTRHEIAIAGNIPSGFSLARKYQNVRFLGVVPDAKEFLNMCKVIAIPSVSGTGIQIKTLEAISTCKPVIATEIAARGINNPPKNLFVARNSKEFAELMSGAIDRPWEDSPKTRAEVNDWWQSRRARFDIGINSLIGSVK